MKRDESTLVSCTGVDERLRRTRALLDGRRDSVEVFHRASATLRVSADSLSRGFEEGLAVRLGSGGFAATSGFGPAAFDRAVIAAERDPTRPTLPMAPPPDGDSPRLDLDPQPVEPDRDALRESLERVRSAVAEAGAALEDAWIEAAATVECVASSLGLLAARSRVRAWSMCLLRVPGTRARRLRSFRAARSVGALEVVDAGELVEVEGDAAVPPTSGLPWVVRPEAAALLIHALARELHGPRSTGGFEVGAGWRLTDDPLDPAALFGGTFDDAGFPTRARVLADDRGRAFRLEGEGNLRRGSFRDRPAVAASNLVLQPSPLEPMDETLTVDSLRIHPGGDRWLLQFEGWTTRDGRPAKAVRDLVVPVEPETLVRRCAGTLGEPRASYRGVITPSVVFRE